jgi:hypothetical protein
VPHTAMTLCRPSTSISPSLAIGRKRRGNSDSRLFSNTSSKRAKPLCHRRSLE